MVCRQKDLWPHLCVHTSEPVTQLPYQMPEKEKKKPWWVILLFGGTFHTRKKLQKQCSFSIEQKKSVKLVFSVTYPLVEMLKHLLFFFFFLMKKMFFSYFWVCLISLTIEVKRNFKSSHVCSDIYTIIFFFKHISDLITTVIKDQNMFN